VCGRVDDEEKVEDEEDSAPLEAWDEE